MKKVEGDRDSKQQRKERDEHPVIPVAEDLDEKDNEAKKSHHHHLFHHHRHGGETHGHREDVNESTSISDIKGPNVFQRAKEEVEAVVESIRHKKDRPPHNSS
ncbi:hypothetical protein ZOSMA_154G00490 [Zostera marina]|uniref:Uncharacterized protein n=1 Tax=Zostera marina TaxID=29655 RepID=A0A0K9PY25_ZOSMR|nr:hypothetical protein ZOSMA_154G00490 [Zostera marina]